MRVVCIARLCNRWAVSSKVPAECYIWERGNADFNGYTGVMESLYPADDTCDGV